MIIVGYICYNVMHCFIAIKANKYSTNTSLAARVGKNWDDFDGKTIESGDL